ncbi:MAG: hypothetical protein JSR67_04500 [Proteobacteria bacterium]|nr:hypothetical protein [Pseudomonadota bacterium]
MPCAPFRCPLSLVAVIGAVAAGPAGAAPSLSGSLVLTSDNVYEGLSLTCGDPAAQADLHLTLKMQRPGSELFAGAWGSAGLGGSQCGNSRELNLYAGVGVAASASSKGALSYVRYSYPGGSYALYGGLRYDLDELNATWSFQDRLSLSAAWTPDAVRLRGWSAQRERSAWAFTATVRQALTGSLSLNAGAGYDCINDPRGTGYGFWSAGAGYALARLQFSVLYVHTTPRAARLFGTDVAGSRVAATVLWAF